MTVRWNCSPLTSTAFFLSFFHSLWLAGSISTSSSLPSHVDLLSLAHQLNLSLTMESLPKGLVTTSARVPSYLEDPSLVDAGDIAHLWKGISHTSHPSSSYPV